MWIDSSIVGFRSAIRKFGIDRYKKNCVLATQVRNRLVTSILCSSRFSGSFNSDAGFMFQCPHHLKGLSHEIDFKNFDKELHNLA